MKFCEACHVVGEISQIRPPRTFNMKIRLQKKIRNFLQPRFSNIFLMPAIHILNHLLISQFQRRHFNLKIYNFVLHPVIVYGCETWSLTVPAQERLRFLENRLLRRILGLNKGPISGRVSVKTNVEIRKLIHQPLIKSVIESRRLR